MGSIGRFFRNFVFNRTSKEFLIFVFFVALSSVFWLSLTLNETYEKEFAIPIRVVGMPKNVVLTSEETDTVHMTIRDKGITLATYIYGEILNDVKVNFKTYAHSNGTGIIPAADLQKIVYQHLASGSKIISTKPDKLEFFYNYGAKKRVPVRWTGRVIPEDLYFISRVRYLPDSIDIYASSARLDSITVAYTEHLNYVNFRDTLMVTANLEKIKGVKMVPDQIKLEFLTDVLTEEKIEGIPVEGINMPPGKNLRTFPMKVTVSFVTGVSVYRSLKPKDFTVVADYNEIAAHPSEKCHIYIKKAPQGISRVHLNIDEVDYLIEENVE
jgi:hypothetical protein